MENLTEEITKMMTKDQIQIIIVILIILLIIFALIGAVPLFLIGLTVLTILNIGLDEKDPHESFLYNYKNNETIEIKTKSDHPLLYNNKNEFKVINYNNDEIILENLNTQKKSKPINKQEFFKVTGKN